MDFIVNKETKTVLIDQGVDAELSLVWDAYAKRGTAKPIVGTESLCVTDKGHGL